MKNLLLILLFSVCVFGRTYYRDAHTSTNHSFSTFAGHFGTEWIKVDSSKIIKDTVYKGNQNILLASTNGGETSIQKTLSSSFDMSTYPWFVLKCHSGQKISTIKIYIFGSGSPTPYAYCSLNISDTASFNEDVTHDWVLPFDRAKMTYYNAGFNWNNVTAIRIGFLAPAGTTDSLFCESVYAQTTGLARAVVLISSDDMYKTNYTQALPIFDTTIGALGLYTDLFVCQRESAEVTPMSLAQLDSFYIRGHRIGSHGWTHGYFNAMGLDSGTKEIYLNMNWIEQIGMSTTNKQIECWPHGEVSDSVEKRVGSFISVGWGTRNLPTRYITTPAINMLNLPRSCLYPRTLSYGTIVKAWLDTAIKYKYAVPIYYHACSDTEVNSVSPDSLKMFCSYVKQQVLAGNLDVMTTDQYFTLTTDAPATQGNSLYYGTQLDTVHTKGIAASGDVSVNSPGGTWYDSSASAFQDFTVTSGSPHISAATSCFDAVFNNTGAGDTVYVDSVLTVGGAFSCAAAVVFKVGPGGAIRILTCTPATLNGNAVRIYYPTQTPISYASAPWTDVIGTPATHALTVGGCALGKDSVTFSGAWPAGYTVNASTGVISWSGTGTAGAGNYVIRAYGNAKTDSASVTIGVTVNAATTTTYRRRHSLGMGIGLGL